MGPEYIKYFSDKTIDVSVQMADMMIDLLDMQSWLSSKHYGEGGEKVKLERGITWRVIPGPTVINNVCMFRLFALSNGKLGIR